MLNVYKRLTRKTPRDWHFLFNIPIVFTLCSSVVGGPIAVGACFEHLIDLWLRFQSFFWSPLELLFSQFFPLFYLDEEIESFITFVTFFLISNIRVRSIKKVSFYEALGGVFLSFSVAILISISSEGQEAYTLLVASIGFFLVGMTFIAYSFKSQRIIDSGKTRKLIFCIGFQIFAATICILLLFFSSEGKSKLNIAISIIVFLPTLLVFLLASIKAYKGTSFLKDIFIINYGFFFWCLGITLAYLIAAEPKSVLSDPHMHLFLFSAYCLCVFTFLVGFFIAQSALQPKILASICMSVFIFLAANFIVVKFEQFQILKPGTCALCLNKCKA